MNQSNEQELTVPQTEDGARLDRLVSVLGGISRKEARKLIGAGAVLIKGRAAKILSKRYRAGTVLKLQVPTAAPQAVTTKTSLDVIYRDHEMIVVNKPSGLLSEHDKFRSPSLESVVPAWLDAQGENSRVWLVHRLDAVTSGVVVLARSPRAAKRLHEAFRERVPKKMYLAVVSEKFPKEQSVDAPIGRLKGTRHGVREDGKPSQTIFTSVVSTARGALVLAAPITGRTHQIRVHLAHLDKSIAGDRLYGGSMYMGPQGGVVVARTMLHAWRLTIPHPRTRVMETFTAPPPADMIGLLNRLELPYEEPLRALSL